MDSSALPKFAEHLLPSNATPLERIFAAVAEKRIGDIPVPLKLLNDPYRVPVAFLNHLAFEVGVDIWNEDWDELKKRSVIAATIRTKEILGTAKAIETYIGLEGGVLIDVVTPPQTPFVSQGFEDSPDYPAYLGRLPQLRVYFGNDKGTAQPGQFFVGVNAYVGTAVPSPDNARQLLGRRAYYYDPIADTETRITLDDLGVADDGSVSESAKLPGKAGKEAFIGGYIGNCFVTNEVYDPPSIVPYTLPTHQSLDAGALALTLGAAFNPIRTRYDRIPVFGTADATQSFVGDCFVGNCFVSSNAAAIDFYDRLYLADPSVPAPVTTGTTFVGHSRLNMEPFRAEMLIDAQETLPTQCAVVGRFVGACFVQEQDDTKRKRILQAIELSKAGRDRVFVDFQVTKTLSLDDKPTLSGGFRLGQRIPRHRL